MDGNFPFRFLERENKCEEREKKENWSTRTEWRNAMDKTGDGKVNGEGKD